MGSMCSEPKEEKENTELECKRNEIIKSQGPLIEKSSLKNSFQLKNGSSNIIVDIDNHKPMINLQTNINENLIEDNNKNEDEDDNHGNFIKEILDRVEEGEKLYTYHNQQENSNINNSEEETKKEEEGDFNNDNKKEEKNELEEKKEEKLIKSDNKSESIIHSEKNELLPEDEFSKIIFENINLIRENPQNFVQMIEDSKKNIIVENSKFKYKSKVKVGLIRGEPAFDEAIAILKLNSPMPKLYFNPNLTIRLPSTIEEIQDKKYFPNQIKNLSNKGIIVNTFWRDNINDPLTSFILMIVDDYKDKGEKRNDILNPNNKSIGICSTMIDNYFACYLVFSQE